MSVLLLAIERRQFPENTLVCQALQMTGARAYSLRKRRREAMGATPHQTLRGLKDHKYHHDLFHGPTPSVSLPSAVVYVVAIDNRP